MSKKRPHSRGRFKEHAFLAGCVGVTCLLRWHLVVSGTGDGVVGPLLLPWAVVVVVVRGRKSLVQLRAER